MNDLLLDIDRLSYRYPGAAQPALNEICCTVSAGECICLTGHSGCGKSTLLSAVMGLLRGGRLSGRVSIARGMGAGSGSCPAGMVFQNAESQLICTSVAEEVAFGPENLCVPPEEIGPRVLEALAAVGMEDHLGRNPERFSAGQKQRVAIASVLAMQPKLLLLDEPTSQLDAVGKAELAGILTRLKRLGYTLIIAEHDPRPFAGLIDRYLMLELGSLIAEQKSAPGVEYFRNRRTEPVACCWAAAGSSLEVAGIELAYPETGTVLNGVSLTVPRGERLHLFGHNGAGKSTLLRCLSGLERPDRGEVMLCGLKNPQPEQLPGKVGVLFQNPARQLFGETVREEVAFTLQRLGLTRPEWELRVAEALEICRIAHLVERAPLTLSFGEQHRVALAAVLAPRPELLLLDEPFAGLDFPQRLALLDILGELPGRLGTTVLIVSHDELPDPRWADRSLILSGGALGERSW
ncbi:hypothetical protein GMLC_26150 [Geomonas limicola]|uniref:ABC transporter domain-containing protein n=1 Tax=Geomonas limicola TaxID=2740186 RepID=A0A6V8N8X8_9BACT|nr:ABC transporter ATP-binding protein [Geomonas limicola]GFO69036.1 hypothetical protein GMLC_26150 [Geomonas limicola]